MEEIKKEPSAIDVAKILKFIYKNRKTYYKVLAIVFVLACIWIFPQPRYYSSDVSLAPETNANPEGGLSSIASTFGISLGGAQNDAIYPSLYPDIFESTEFIVSLFDIQVETLDGSVKTNYYDYLLKHQKANPITQPFKAMVRSVKNMFESKEDGKGNPDVIDPFMLTKQQELIVRAVKGNIKCNVDKKNDVTTIVVRDQDRLVCATIADSVRVRLQNFITMYRTSKARIDLDYYVKLADEAKADYNNAVAAYSSYCDSHKDVILQSYISKRDELENQMSMKFNTYTAMCSQLESAKAKVQDRTPAFTTLKNATVPIKPAGPKRMIFVFGCLVFAFLGTYAFTYYKQVLNVSTEEKQVEENEES